MDNIDIKLRHIEELDEEQRRQQYRTYCQELSKKNIGHIKRKEVAARYGLPEKYNQDGIWHIPTKYKTFPSLRDDLAKLVNETKFERGVDIGCGTMTFFEFVMVKDPLLVDISDEYCRFMSEQGWKAVVGDIENLDLSDNSMDIVVCSDVLEHVLSFNQALSEVSRVLKATGYFLVNVPWKQDLSKISHGGFPHLRAFDEMTLNERFDGWNYFRKM